MPSADQPAVWTGKRHAAVLPDQHDDRDDLVLHEFTSDVSGVQSIVTSAFVDALRFWFGPGLTCFAHSLHTHVVGPSLDFALPNINSVWVVSLPHLEQIGNSVAVSTGD